MQNIVLLGPPGSGKGTQAKLLSKCLGYHHISTGDLLRKAIEQKGDIGSNVEALLSSGRLVPDDMVMEIVTQEYDHYLSIKSGFIFDGFPRTLGQSRALSDMLSAREGQIDCLIKLDASDDIIKQRILGRYSCVSCGTISNKYFCGTTFDGKCSNCGSSELSFRSDDNEDTIIKRLANYRLDTLPVLDYLYGDCANSFVINAESDTQSILDEIIEKIGV